MRLDRVEVKNFRSIAEATVRLTPRCRILIGINESGKSSFLQALALLAPDRPIARHDIRTVAQHESDVTESYVQFVFALDKNDIARVQQAVAERFATGNLDKPMLSIGAEQLSIRQFVEQQTEALYVADLLENLKYWTTWDPPVTPKLLVPIKRPIANSSDKLFHVSEVANDAIKTMLEAASSVGALQDATGEDIVLLVRDEIEKTLAHQVPNCVLWTYKEENLLPTKINLAQFTANPDICIPLKHIFILAGYADISAVIRQWDGVTNGLANLLRRIAQKATEHIRDVWKEHPGITIELRPDGDSIIAAVQDTYNVYDFSLRSDGFKRFITFLLMVSATAKTNHLTNTLYLHDEPDTSLHPSAARSLREELIKIATDNYVIYSTHSIFMIDRDRIDRHLIVRKDNELTTVAEADVSNVVDEEVLYNALGYSIFETLKQKNIVFEGWRDKKLFQIALTHIPAEHEQLKKLSEGIGVCHAKGVKDVERITPILELANRSWIVISDADKVAVDYQRAYKGNGRWYRYDELLENSDVLTSEDFIKPDALYSAVQQLAEERVGLANLDRSRLSIPKGRIHVVLEWLRENGIASDDLRTLQDRFKSILFENLKPNAIEERYYTLLGRIAGKVENMRTAEHGVWR